MKEVNKLITLEALLIDFFKYLDLEQDDLKNIIYFNI